MNEIRISRDKWQKAFKAMEETEEQLNKGLRLVGRSRPHGARYLENRVEDLEDHIERLCADLTKLTETVATLSETVGTLGSIIAQMSHRIEWAPREAGTKQR